LIPVDPPRMAFNTQVRRCCNFLAALGLLSAVVGCLAGRAGHMMRVGLNNLEIVAHGCCSHHDIPVKIVIGERGRCSEVESEVDRLSQCDPVVHLQDASVPYNKSTGGWTCIGRSLRVPTPSFGWSEKGKVNQCGVDCGREVARSPHKFYNSQREASRPRTQRSTTARLDRRSMTHTPPTSSLPRPSPTYLSVPPQSTPPPPSTPPPDSPFDRFLSLGDLPTVHKPLSGPSAGVFAGCVESLAEAFMAEPSDDTLFNILALPKAGLAPGLKQGLKARLERYPRVDWPRPEPNDGTTPRTTTAVKDVEKGRLGSAARRLAGTAAVATVDNEVVATLRDKHPAGAEDPFGPTDGPSSGDIPSEEEIMAAFKTFKPDTSPGLSGWTHHLLATALRVLAFLKAIHTLTGLIMAGTAPGQAMLCASRLTPLRKPDGGLRPIAVGDMIYRLATKAIIRHSNRRAFLLPYQFGVGSKGGVEPVVRAVERALDGTLDRPYTHLTSLDFSNAFNTVDRRDIAEGLRQYAPILYRAGRWAYGCTSSLVLGSPEGRHIIISAQGVRQGDPMGPLMFSLGIRSLLRDLASTLGPDRLILAHLDDIYILSPDDKALEQTLA
jgi:hypothetical protein